MKLQVDLVDAESRDVWNHFRLTKSALLPSVSYEDALRLLHNLAFTRLTSKEQVRQALQASFTDEFITLCVRNWAKGEHTTFVVEFDE